MSANLLAGALSPYLLQHKDNPVHWRPWGDEALAEAKRANRPILLSVGYSSCHWCHVMAHESFEDAEIAAAMNEHFVNIKVDREERPDIDAIYMRALQLAGGQGGWPLTMFLTPDAEPFWGGTYFPPRARAGRPGFLDVLHAIARLFRDEPEKVNAATQAMAKGLQELARPAAAGSLPPGDIAVHTRRFLQLTDAEYGGIPAGAPKFPQTQALELLWRGWRRDGDAACRDAVLRAIDGLCLGGMYDHLGGGFCRYSTDRQWLVPHFEKMLYDNALLVSLLTAVWQDNASDLCRRRIDETAGWMLREMRLEGGAFAASLDADSPGGEGSFYVWRGEEIDAVLGTDAALFKAAYDVAEGGNWEGVSILNRRTPEAQQAAEDAALAPLRARLLEAREKRERPARDDKIMADWNGLAIAALAQAGAALQRGDWMQAALDAFAFVNTEMSDGGRLLHIKGGDRAFSADYANMIRAGLLLHQLHGGDGFLDAALGWCETLDRHYAGTGEGWFDTAEEETPAKPIVRLSSFEDGAQPCANFTMAESFASLFHLAGEDKWRRRCEALLAAGAGGLAAQPFGLAGLLNAADQLHHAARVQISGSGAAAEALLQVARSAPGPGLVVAREAGGAPAAVVCRAERCSLPITDGELLRRSLAAPGAFVPGA